MNGRRKSDRRIVPRKPPNKGSGAPGSAEGVEGRRRVEGNPSQRPSHRTQSRARLREELRRIRQAARRNKEERFTALWHHVYDVDRLRAAYFALNRKGSPGVDRVTWAQYGEDLEGHLADLSERLRRGAYRAKAVERAYVPKRDGRQRPIGKPTLEDKIVQRAFAEVVGAVYEADFLGFSYGFRPGRNAHNALDALSVGITTRKVNWVLEADIRGFFDAIDHEWLLKFLQHRIADPRVLRQVRRWLRAGVVEGTEWTAQTEGTPQGGSVSPLLGNVYLHYVFDLWAHRWRGREASGEVIIVRYADDFVLGFQYEWEARRFLAELIERFRAFGLELHADKTRLIRFGRFAAAQRQERGHGKPETFDFLGFTHVCATNRQGRFVVRRRTQRSRVRGKLGEVKSALRRRSHHPVPEVGHWLAAVLRGHYAYYGVPHNYQAMSNFRHQVTRHWFATLRRRSQRTRVTWERMNRLATRWLPRPQITHPYPEQRLCVTT